MPVLKTKRETKKLNLLSDPEAWVEVYVSQTYGDFLEIQKASMSAMKVTGGQQESSSGLEADLSSFMTSTLERMIVAWNFTNEAGEPLPVTMEHIKLMDTKDVLFIFNEISKTAGVISDVDKKKDEK